MSQPFGLLPTFYTAKAIIMILSYASIVAPPFCDYLNVTFPSYAINELEIDLNGLFDSIGLSHDEAAKTYHLANSPGALKFYKNARYAVLSISAGILKHMREQKAFDTLIEIISKYEHKITRCDATADFHVPYAPDTIARYKNLVQTQDVYLTRKKIGLTEHETRLSNNINGDETGTIYLGHTKTHSVCCKVYDKTHEQQSKYNLTISQTVRVEITLKNDTGVSLRDVHNPESIFYNYAYRSLVEPPPHFTGWLPNGSSYQLPPQKDLFTPAGKILNIFKNSNDIARACTMAVKAYGDDALDTLVQQLRTVFKLRFSEKPNSST